MSRAATSTTAVVHTPPAPTPSLVRTLSATALTPVVFATLARVFECVVIAGVGLGIAQILAPTVYSLARVDYAMAAIGPALSASWIFARCHLYTVAALEAPRRSAAGLMLGWCAIIAGLAALDQQRTAHLSPLFFALYAVSGVAALTLSRIAVMLLLRTAKQAGYLTRTAVIYGHDHASARLISRLQDDPLADVRICGVFDDRSTSRSEITHADYPYLGDIKTLKAIVRRDHVDMVIMTLPLAAEARLAALTRSLAELPIDVRLATASAPLLFHPSAYSYLGTIPTIALAERPIVGWNAVAKRLFDVAIALVAIVLLAPVMALVAIAVKFESTGPALFRQKRYGFNNELIEICKFRSMYADRADATASRLVTKNDGRVTRVGRIIRKTSLDELPQLFNVLSGVLSLVGPRPHAVQAKAADRLYPDVVDGYFARHKVKPGITGYAQINGWRGETDTHEKIQKRVEFDLAYIDNWSVWLDVVILAKTPAALLKTDNAY